MIFNLDHVSIHSLPDPGDRYWQGSISLADNSRRLFQLLPILSDANILLVGAENQSVIGKRLPIT